MNYKSIAFSELKEISNENPDYTLGQVLLTVIQRKPEECHIKEWLRDITDEDLYSEIEKAKLKQR